MTTTGVNFSEPSRDAVSDAGAAFLKAQSGNDLARWRVLADCREYLRFVVRQGKWSNGLGGARTSDLVQRTIVDAWQKFSGFRGTDDRQLRGWVKAILINAARNDRRNSRPIDADPRVRLDGLVDPGPSPVEAVAESERTRRIDAAMSALKERDRMVIRLRVWNGLSFAEIGRELGVSEDAARMQFSRSLDRLRKQLRSLHGIE